MKTGGGKGFWFKPLTQALIDAGYELARRSNSHLHYKAPQRQPVTVPCKLDDVKIAKRLAKIAGVEL